MGSTSINIQTWTKSLWTKYNSEITIKFGSEKKLVTAKQFPQIKQTHYGQTKNRIKT